tara:strand:- start:752 stop:1066 length:315 start_codon:yes stop_codon:yes gene_type:complete
MNKLLTPEKNISLLKKYHTSSKLLIPLIGISYLSNKYDYKYSESVFNTLNILNIGYHSYVSTSCVITDYIKPKTISTMVRGTSLSFHGLATIGFIYNMYNNFKK